MSEELFTITQTAQYLKVCEKTVRRLIGSNKLIASKVGERKWRIRKDDIDVYLREHTNSREGGSVNE